MVCGHWRKKGKDHLSISHLLMPFPQRHTWRWRRWQILGMLNTLSARTSTDCIWNLDWSVSSSPSYTATCSWRIAISAAGETVMIFQLLCCSNPILSLWSDNLYVRRRLPRWVRRKRVAFAKAGKQRVLAVAAICWTTSWTGSTIYPKMISIWHSIIRSRY